MIIIGDVPVAKSRFEKSLFDKKGFAWYQSLAEIVHSCGCKLCAQLHQSDSNMAAMLKYVPGVLTKKITLQRKEVTEIIGDELTNDEISEFFYFCLQKSDFLSEWRKMYLESQDEINAGTADGEEYSE